MQSLQSRKHARISRRSYHEKLGFVDPLVPISVEHIEGDLETSFRLCNGIDYRREFTAALHLAARH